MRRRQPDTCGPRCGQSTLRSRTATRLPREISPLSIWPPHSGCSSAAPSSPRAVHDWTAAEAQVYPGNSPCAVSLTQVEEWDPPVPMRTVLSQIDQSAGARADFEVDVVRITGEEYATALSVATDRATRPSLVLVIALDVQAVAITRHPVHPDGAARGLAEEDETPNPGSGGCLGSASAYTAAESVIRCRNPLSRGGSSCPAAGRGGLAPRPSPTGPRESDPATGGSAPRRARAAWPEGNRRLHQRWQAFNARKKKPTIANVAVPASSPAGPGRWRCIEYLAHRLSLRHRLGCRARNDPRLSYEQPS